MSGVLEVRWDVGRIEELFDCLDTNARSEPAQERRIYVRRHRAKLGLFIFCDAPITSA